jgi:hypothetical protein
MSIPFNLNVSAVCGSLDSEAAAAAAVRRSDCAAARCYCGTARVRQLSRQDLAGQEPAEVTVHLADCQWSAGDAERPSGGACVRPQPVFESESDSIYRALFGQRIIIFGNKIVGYVWMNVIRTNSVDNNDFITILN